MHKMLFAAFPDHANAERTFTELAAHGFDAKDLSVITKEHAHTASGHATAGGVAAGTAGGITTGGVLGGLAGFLAGAGVFPALAGLLIGGPVAALLGLTGVAAATVSGAVTGAVAGGLVGALMGIGFSRDEAEAYHQTVEAGGLLVAVPVTDTSEDEARAILLANHAEQIKLITANTDILHRHDDMTASEAGRILKKSTSPAKKSHAATRLEREHAGTRH